MNKIVSVRAWEILDSRGIPTVEAEVVASCGARAIASVPSGASKGTHEAFELRDGDVSRYSGRGVLTAVENINKVIAPAIVGFRVMDQRMIDRVLCALDPTQNKSVLGANAILAVSLAVARCAANSLRMPLYRYLGGCSYQTKVMPMINILNAASHSSSPIAFQEFMIRPIGASDVRTAVEMGAGIFHALKKILKDNNLSTAVGDEGGYAPMISSAEEALDMVVEAIIVAGYTPTTIAEPKAVSIALDVAASEFYKNQMYDYSIFEGSKGRRLNGKEQVDLIEKLVDSYPIDSIEDGMAQDDWQGWQMLTQRIGDRCQIVGDDLFVTNSEYLKKGIYMGVANSILIKPNQIGTLTETLQTIALAHQNGYSTVISHRSGETNDTFIADLAVATASGQIKCGSLSRGERVNKYNRLMEIDDACR